MTQGPTWSLHRAAPVLTVRCEWFARSPSSISKADAPSWRALTRAWADQITTLGRSLATRAAYLSDAAASGSRQRRGHRDESHTGVLTPRCSVVSGDFRPFRPIDLRERRRSPPARAAPRNPPAGAGSPLTSTIVGCLAGGREDAHSPTCRFVETLPLASRQSASECRHSRARA
jgi:hypothetical protein